MSRRKANLEIEYAQEREISDLKDQITKLKKKLREQEKSATIEKEPAKKAVSLKKINKPCPDCGCEIKTTDLPHAVMELCSNGCGFRNVRSKK